MNIKQALKRKNKLVQEIKTEFEKVEQYNSISETNFRPYSAKRALENWVKLTNELVNVKTNIHLANAPVYPKIFQLSELKNQVKLLKTLDCTEGVPSRSRYDSVDLPSRKAEITVIERDSMIKDMETQIETIQDELDEWNHTTQI